MLLIGKPHRSAALDKQPGRLWGFSLPEVHHEYARTAVPADGSIAIASVDNWSN
jgi:hypothetical protein